MTFLDALQAAGIIALSTIIVYVIISFFTKK